LGVYRIAIRSWRSEPPRKSLRLPVLFRSKPVETTATLQQPPNSTITIDAPKHMRDGAGRFLIPGNSPIVRFVLSARLKIGGPRIRGHRRRRPRDCSRPWRSGFGARERGAGQCAVGIAGAQEVDETLDLGDALGREGADLLDECLAEAGLALGVGGHGCQLGYKCDPALPHPKCYRRLPFDRCGAVSAPEPRQRP